MKSLQSYPPEVEWSFYGTPRFKRNKIMLVGGHLATTDPLRVQLLEAGFQVVIVENARTALVRAAAIMPSLMVLDADLTSISGFELCRLLKGQASTSHIPIILHKSEPTEQERILGFELGADDFVPSPSSPLEMVLRIKSSLRRSEQNLPAEIKMCLADLVLDPIRHEVSIQNNLVQVTSTEFRLLLVFMEHVGRMLNREVLLREVWGQTGTAVTRTVDTHVRRLRSRLGSWARHLESIHGVGYRLNEALSPVPLNRRGRRIKYDKSPRFPDRSKRKKAAFSVGRKHRTTAPSRNASLLLVADIA